MDSSLKEKGLISGHTRRARRAIAFGALAVLVTGVAGLAYLRSSAATPSKAIPTRPSLAPVVRAGDAVAYDFVSPNLGWAAEAPMSRTNAAGPFVILRTQDGARHWQPQLSGESAHVWVPLATLKMRNKDDGYLIAGNPLQLYRTTDGGSHWRPSRLPTQETGQLNFSDDSHAWILTLPTSTLPSVPGPHLYSSTDGGNSWTALPDPPEDLDAIEFRGPLEGWGSSGGPGLPSIYTSEDGGYTWKKHALPIPQGSPKDSGYASYVQLLPGGGVLAEIFAGDLDSRLTSLDWGASWQISMSPTGNASTSEWSYAYQDAEHWWAINATSLFKSSDAGQSWTRPTNSVPAGLDLVRIFDWQHAWAESKEGSVYFTSDGGLHWTFGNVPMPLNRGEQPLPGAK